MIELPRVIERFASGSSHAATLFQTYIVEFIASRGNHFGALGCTGMLYHGSLGLKCCLTRKRAPATTVHRVSSYIMAHWLFPYFSFAFSTC